jgi:hypothetical protein
MKRPQSNLQILYGKQQKEKEKFSRTVREPKDAHKSAVEAYLRTFICKR